MATWLQAGHWRNSITLFEHALEVTSDNYVAYNNLGNARAVQGRLDEAIERFAAAIQIQPNNPRSLNNMGAALMLKGENEKAIHLFKRALEIRPDYTDALKNLERVKEQPGLMDSNAIL
jgi:Flp pilus assembly protein TadD